MSTFSSQPRKKRKKDAAAPGTGRLASQSGFKLVCLEVLMWLGDLGANLSYESSVMKNRSGAACERLFQGAVRD